MYGKPEQMIPRNGETAEVGLVSRISGGPNQKDVSLEDQNDHCRDIAAELFNVPINFREVSTTAKGERIDRPELRVVENWLRSRELDLLIVEDLGRLVRGTAAVTLCGVAVDHGVRVIAPNDGVDTSEDTWEEDAIEATRSHVSHNSHTSKRIKHKMMNRFKRKGEVPSRPVFGYFVPPGAKTYAEWQKDPAATPVIQEAALRLLEHKNCSLEADRFNEWKIPTGKYVRTKKWSGSLIRRLFANPILKGLAQRGARHTVKHHETGRRVSVKNPKGPTTREFPHLAHISSELFDHLNDVLDKANEGRGRKTVNGVDPLFQRPTSRTRFPGQHTVCWYCGRRYVWGGNGITANLVCKGTREWRCWNSIGIRGELVATSISDAVLREVQQLAGFDVQWREWVEDARRKGSANCDQDYSRLLTEQDEVLRQRKRLLALMLGKEPDPLYENQMMQFKLTERRIAQELSRIERVRQRPLQLPNSISEIHTNLERDFAKLAISSLEFGLLLRQIVPSIHVYLVQLCNGGNCQPRARIELDLAGIVPDARHVSGSPVMLNRVLSVDLFEPFQRELIRVDAVRMVGEGYEQRQIARQLSVTQAGVHHALRLDRHMRELGLSSPYVFVPEPPADLTKLRRYKHPRYRFEPLPGYERPNLDK